MSGSSFHYFFKNQYAPTLLGLILPFLFYGADTGERIYRQAGSRPPAVEVGPFVGAVTDTSAVFVVKTSSPAAVRIQLSEDSLFSLARLSGSYRTDDTTYRYAKIPMDGLVPDRRYFYRVIVNDVASDPVHRFRAFPAGAKSSFAFGFGSCQQGPWPSNPVIFPIIARDTLRFFLQMGDWTYPDYQISDRFSMSMNLLARSYDMRYASGYPFTDEVLSIMPVAYVYDDHDYAGDDADGTAPGKLFSIRAYSMFFPHYPLANRQNGVWQKFSAGGVDFFLLDLRSQRSPDREAFNGAGKFQPRRGHSILAGFPISGKDQRIWLLESLRSSTAEWKVIASSVIFNPRYMDALKDDRLLQNYPQVRDGLLDKWAGFPADVNDLLQAIRKNGIKNVIVISGDSHSSFIDDGKNSVLPEISCSNLDVPNSDINSALLQAGYNVWDKGSLDGKSYAYGKVSFVYGHKDYALLEIVDAGGAVIASCRIEAM